MIRHRVILYHDEPYEAAADTRSAGLYASEREAIAAARRSFAKGAEGREAGYWTSATVDRGRWDPGEPGIRPAEFTEDGSAPSAYVGPDWIDR